eukprot:COSAG02_NODE_1443_length_12584_cov_2.587425_14_plen_60_part_00
MESKGYVASDVTGKPFTDGMGGRNCRLVDPSNPDAAKYIWYVRFSLSKTSTVVLRCEEC